MSTPAPLENFSEDKLNLKSFAEDLTRIIMSPLPHPTNEYSKVIALYSGWGTGKTSFINMWTNDLKLKTDSKFICHTYNAWENDDSPDALIPILCSFQQLEKQKPDVMHLVKECLKHVSLSISLPLSPVGVTLDINGEARTKSPDTILKEFSARQEHKEELKKLIEGIRK